MLLETGDLRAARDLLISIYYDYEPVTEVVFALGRIAEQKGFILEALGYYREARTINQAMGAAWLREGLMLRRLGLSSEAERCLQSAAGNGSTAAKHILESLNRLDAPK